MSRPDFPDGWEVKNLEDCVEILDRHRDPINSNQREQRLEGVSEDERIPYYGATGQVGWIDDYLFDEELVLLGEDGAPFIDPTRPTAYIIRGKSWVNNHAHVLKGKDDVLENKFLMHYLNTVEYKEYITGTTRYKLNQTRMREIPVPVPSLDIQKQISYKIEELFSKLDSGVKDLKDTEQRLELYKRAVLKAAMEGDLTKETRGATSVEGSSYLEKILEHRRERWNEEFQEVFKYSGKEYEEPESVDPPENIQIPNEWTWGSINQISYVVGGLTKNKSKREDYSTEVPYLRVANVYANELDLEKVKTIKISERERNTKMLQEGDLLVVEGNGSKSQIGRVAMWDGSISPISHQNHLIKIRILPQELRKFVVYWMLSPVGRKTIVNVASSTSGLHTLSISKVRSIPVPIPPAKEAKKIVKEIEQRMTIADQVLKDIKKENERSGYLRQSILTHAFEGNLMPHDQGSELQLQTSESYKSENKSSNPEGQLTLSEVTKDAE